MTEAILEFFSGLPDWLYVLVISMLPIVELRGAIPVGAGIGMEYYLCYPLAVIGNMIPVPFILLFIPRILDFMARFRIFRPIVAWLRKKANKHSKRVLKNDSEPLKIETVTSELDTSTPTSQEKRRVNGSIFAALLIFVAIPLPGTGAWTGSLVASLFNLQLKKSALAIFAGVLISGVIMSLISYGILGFLSFLI